MTTTPTKKDIALGVYNCGLLNFGEFTFKSGIKSPMYMNLRNLGSHPKFLRQVTDVFTSMMKGASFDLVGGIPYGAIPIMCSVSMELEVPLIFPRKESKEYGMAKDIVGDFSQGQNVALVDDLVTDGGSKTESLVPLEAAGLKVKDIFVLLDYDRGAKDTLAADGYTLHSFMTVTETVDLIYEAGLIEESTHERAKEFLTSA